MNKTKLIYLDQTHLFSAEAKVVTVTQSGDHNSIIVVDQTNFYPRGGGQSCDCGEIVGPQGMLSVETVWSVEGLVQHCGPMQGTIVAGDQVKLNIDSQRRQLNSRLHTAGHLLDEVIYGFDYHWEGLGAGQIDDIAWVDYTGEFDRSRDYKTHLQTELNKLIAAALPVTVKYYQRDDLEKVCYFLCHRMPDVDKYRVVFAGAKKGNLCGGTHVTNTEQVGQIKIRKVKCKKGKIIVSYMLVKDEAN